MFALSRFVTSKYREYVGERGDDVSETGGKKSRHVRRFGDENRLAKIIYANLSETGPWAPSLQNL